MTTRSRSQECATEELAEYRRLCLIAAEYTKQHKEVTIACAMRLDGSGFIGVALIGEDKPRRFFEVSRGVSREELFRLFDDAAGITAEPVSDDEWDW